MDYRQTLFKLLNAKTKPSIDRVLQDLISTKQVKWRLVGDRPNNTGTIEISSNPETAIIERITNAFDATSEKEVDKNNEYKKSRILENFRRKSWDSKGELYLTP